VESSPAKGPSAENWRASFAQTVERNRLAASERVAKERERLREHEAKLTAKLDEAMAQLNGAHQDALSAAAKAEARDAELQQWKQRLEERERQFQEWQAELEQQREALQAKLQEQLELNRQQADASREEANQHAAELERIRREAREQTAQQQSDSSAASDTQIQLLGQQVGQLLNKFSQQEAVWAETNRRLSEQLEQASAVRSDATAAELQALREENRQLEARLAEAEQRAKSAPAGAGANSQEIDDLRRRFEMAVQDVRELKTKNTELTDQLAKAKQALPAQSGGGGSDWESLKKKMLAQMETDFDESDEQQKADKLTVQGAIKITDDVIAEKDHELQELRRLLDSQTQQVGEVAVGAAAVAQLLDTDELVRQERESLKRLQDSLREQLRQAEVDISLERAKLARERTELDEKLRVLQSEKASLIPGAEMADKKGGQPSRRKWLARLGLGDGEGDQ
jgi:hypothetical protein